MDRPRSAQRGLVLSARPLRLDAARLLLPLSVIPGLAMAAMHAPLALLAFGPVALTAWALARRERYRLDHCAVSVVGPALRLRYGDEPLDALDLRWASRQVTRAGDVVLSEGSSGYLVFGVDPPGDPVVLETPGTEDGLPLGFWRAVRLSADDMRRLHEALAAVPPRAQPDLGHPLGLLEALGSVGRWGPVAEAQLARQVRDHGQGPLDQQRGGLLPALQELALRQDAVGEGARRVLAQAGTRQPP